MNPAEIKHLMASPLDKLARDDEGARLLKFIQEGGSMSNRDGLLTSLKRDVQTAPQPKKPITYAATNVRPQIPHIAPKTPHVVVPPESVLAKIHPAALGLGGAALLGGAAYAAHKAMKKEAVYGIDEAEKTLERGEKYRIKADFGPIPNAFAISKRGIGKFKTELIKLRTPEAYKNINPSIYVSNNILQRQKRHLSQLQKTVDTQSIATAAGREARDKLRSPMGHILGGIDKPTQLEKNVFQAHVTGHELDELSAMKRSKIKPNVMREMNHYDPSVIYKEHNRALAIAKDPDTFRAAVPLAKGRYAGLENKLLFKGVDPRLTYGGGERFSRHAIRRLSEAAEKKYMANPINAVKSHAGNLIDRLGAWEVATAAPLLKKLFKNAANTEDLTQALSDYQNVGSAFEKVPHDQLVAAEKAGKLKMFRHGERDLSHVVDWAAARSTPKAKALELVARQKNKLLTMIR